jgi:hydroxymethylpyrimidine/phosphomethylpyrimidine kinase
MGENLPTALTIAGSDSGGGAGIQADLKTFQAMGVFGTSAITAVTAQNTDRVAGVFVLTPEMVAEQIEAVMEDISPAAVKTGMLADAVIIDAVAGKVEQYNIKQLVVDPVMVATSGTTLIDPNAVGILTDRLLPLALVVTPNLAEAGALAGFLIYDGEEMHYLRSPRLTDRKVHGTGCTFSAAITAGLALGLSPNEAIAEAKSFIIKVLTHPLNPGQGAATPNLLDPILNSPIPIPQ